jgi:hypothetical protein
MKWGGFKTKKEVVSDLFFDLAPPLGLEPIPYIRDLINPAHAGL